MDSNMAHANRGNDSDHYQSTGLQGFSLPPPRHTGGHGSRTVSRRMGRAAPNAAACAQPHEGGQRSGITHGTARGSTGSSSSGNGSTAPRPMLLPLPPDRPAASPSAAPLLAGGNAPAAPSASLLPTTASPSSASAVGVGCRAVCGGSCGAAAPTAQSLSPQNAPAPLVRVPLLTLGL